VRPSGSRRCCTAILAAYRHGVARNTDRAPRRSLSITAVEESLVVSRRHGKHVWNWQLHTGDWIPRISLIGRVSFASRHSVSGIVIDKPVILDRARPQHHAKGHPLGPSPERHSRSRSTIHTADAVRHDPIINIQAACNVGTNASTTSA